MASCHRIALLHQDNLTHNVTENDVQELESMQRDVRNIEELVQCKRKALEELKKITTGKKIKKEDAGEICCLTILGRL